MKKKIILALFLLGFAITANCSQLSRLTLTDGSVIAGEIISVENNIYTIKTENLGEVRIEATKIHSITKIGGDNLPATDTASPAGIAPAGFSNDQIKARMNQMQAKITSNPEVMQSVTSLYSDPQFQEAINDPEIVSAVKSQNFGALMKNEKFREIMNNQKVKEIQEKINKQEK